jgi:hypothetical protein
MLTHKLLLSSRKDSPSLGCDIVYDTESNWNYSLQNYTSVEQVAELNNYIGTSNVVTIPDSIVSYNTFYNTTYSGTSSILNSTSGKTVTSCYMGCRIKHRLTTMANMFYDSAKLMNVEE